MSRAFVNEDAGNDRPDLPELPVPPGPNIVTPRGLAALHTQIAQRQADLAALKTRAERLDKLPEAAAERGHQQRRPPRIRGKHRSGGQPTHQLDQTARDEIHRDAHGRAGDAEIEIPGHAEIVGETRILEVPHARWTHARDGELIVEPETPVGRAAVVQLTTGQTAKRRKLRVQRARTLAQLGIRIRELPEHLQPRPKHRCTRTFHRAAGEGGRTTLAGLFHQFAAHIPLDSGQQQPLGGIYYAQLHCFGQR